MTDEQWRPVPGFDGIYEVSDHGRVKSLERTCSHVGGQRRVRERILKPLRQATCANGKLQVGTVGLYRDEGKARRHSVSKLVLLAFVGEPPLGHVAHVKNGNPSDLRLSNLEWATPTEVVAQTLRLMNSAPVEEECAA